MNRRQLNVLSMFQAVLSHLDQFPATWQPIAPAVPLIAGFRTNVAELLTQSQLQEQHNTVGHTQNKDQHFDKLRDAMHQLSLKARAYAKSDSLYVMLQDVDFPYSALENTSEQLLLQRGARIAQHTRQALPSLEPYQVTEAEITALEKLIAEAAPLAPQRNVIAGSRKTATSTIPEIINAAKEKLDILDDLVEGLVTDVTFAETYFNLRRINDTPGRNNSKPSKDN
ncbi:hypothetical protein [Chitinophaga nivalis]|uniref:Uncharacterized protein n=1 Tax=Chitinophaga nivalis TaxID=2991709 RepID=A0ABT3IF24_9BACT|nr:hypothetical protein [Chitinophaga nivalis]MCW3467753.1 hypothetical protein [Chitinophaga nivalis]MCW3482555.1 hypothetical protein [Chitinophaga nivalis]